MIRFCGYRLRTTDIPAARAFYAPFVDLDGGTAEIVALPARIAVCHDPLGAIFALREPAA